LSIDSLILKVDIEGLSDLTDLLFLLGNVREFWSLESNVDASVGLSISTLGSSLDDILDLVVRKDNVNVLVLT